MFLPTYSSWLNWIEAEFTALRYFALNGTDHRSPREVAEEAFRLADGCTASMKKDGLVNTGGFLGLRDPDLAGRCELLLVATEGFPTYGGLAGRDLDMLAQGLIEVTDPDYLRSRAGTTAYLAELARAAGVAVVEPRLLRGLRCSTTRITDLTRAVLTLHLNAG